jgi:septal ring factor EnvC (AmiA/AmiB activator)
VTEDASPEWLDLLETTVRRATEEIGRLRADNGTLRDRVDQLEDELARAREAADASPDEAAEAWRTERSEIRGRVEKLTEKLEGLLDASEESDDDSDD